MEVGAQRNMYLGRRLLKPRGDPVAPPGGLVGPSVPEIEQDEEGSGDPAASLDQATYPDHTQHNQLPEATPMVCLHMTPTWKLAKRPPLRMSWRACWVEAGPVSAQLVITRSI